MEYALVLLWFVAFQALAFAALPVVARLFPRFPDRGAAFALPVALVVVTTVVFWVGHLGFDRWTILVGVLALVGISAALMWNDWSLAPTEESGVPARAYAETIIVFAIAFALLVAVRAIDPAIVPGGGEKFLDFGIFKSLMRADALPPQDMWWAGEPVVYYYGGHLMAATLSYLTGTAPRYAYNLALSGFYASLVTAAYGLGAALADARGGIRQAGGTFAAFFVGFASNLVVPVTGLIWLLPDSIANGLTNWVANSLRSPNGNLSSAAKLVQKGLSEFGYWGPSRVIPGTINEFPLFAFYNGDLHGHMLSTQFLLLIAALGFAYYLTPPEEQLRRRVLAFGALPVVVALLGLVNTWSLPTGLGVAWLALTFAPGNPRSLFPGGSPEESDDPNEPDEPNDPEEPGTAVSDGGKSATGASPATVVRDETRRVVSALAGTAVVAVLSVAWLAPFVFGILLDSTSNRSIETLPTHSTATGLLLVHGAFLLVFGLYLWPRASETFNVDRLRAGFLAVLVAFAAWYAGYAVLALVVPFLLVGWLLLRGGGNVGYETVLLVAGAGLVTLVEFVYVKDGTIPGRFNTVFKVYMQVWVLWATAAGAMLAVLVSDRPGPDWSLSLGGIDASRADLLSVVAAILVVSTGLYGGFTLQSHFTTDDGEFVDAEGATIDGLAYLETYHPGEAEAIHWLDAKEGQPHIVTTPGSPYRWSSPAPSLTGLPTVIGWVYQEMGYRGAEVAKAREQDVDQLYTGDWSTRAELLRKYDVEYVYVGPLEREAYPNADLNFADEPGIEVAFQNDNVVVYRVNYDDE